MTPAILVPLIVFGSVVAIVKMGIDYQKWKDGERDAASDRTLRTSELNAMIEDAVAEATAPLKKRIEMLERRLPEGDRRHELSPREHDEG